MGLVDYSSSESEAETKPQQAAASKQAAPPRFSGNKVEKLRGADGKIRVTLNETKDESAPSDRPAKRAKTGGGRFSGFNSFLPPPKNAGKPTAFGGASSTAGKASAVAPRPGVHLKTGAAPGFSRDTEDGSGGVTREGDESQKKASDGPTIPEGMKPEDEVKFVGKPLMFKPLSVARKMGKKNGAKPVAKTPSSSTPIAPTSKATASTTTTPQGQPKPAPLPPKKVSLFSLPAAEEPTEQSTTSTYEYETIAPQNTFVPVLQPSTNTAMATPPDSSLDAVADDLNLSAAARRDLFGRGNKASAAQVRSFDLDAEYRANEEWRVSAAAEQQQVQRPVAALMASGKTNLRQLVNHVTNQREVLEESFASGKSKRKEAGGRYGW